MSEAPKLMVLRERLKNLNLDIVRITNQAPLISKKPNKNETVTSNVEFEPDKQGPSRLMKNAIKKTIEKRYL